MRTERSPIFRNAGIDPGVISRKIQLLLDAIDLMHDLPHDQVVRGVACLTKAQWIAADAKIKRMRHGEAASDRSPDASGRAFERWKQKIRLLGLEAKTPAHIEFDAPAFCVDMVGLERILEEAQVQIRALRSFRPGKTIREYTVEEVADELGVGDGLIASWARAGMPHSIGHGSGSPRLFDVDETRAWLLEHGSQRAKAAVRRSCVTAETLGEVIATSDSMTEARERLGMSDHEFRRLRRERKVHVPVAAADRIPAWEVVRRDEFLNAIEKHEGRRSGIGEELGLSPYEVRSGIAHYGLKEHALVLRPRTKKPFTLDQLLEAIEKHKGVRSDIARALGSSKGVVLDAIIDFELDDHPLLQYAKIPHNFSRAGRDIGRGAPGKPGLRARGHALSEPVDRTDRFVPFWLAALREIIAAHPGRGASRRASEATGISPPQITNMLKGNRLPGYEYMQAIMRVAGRPEPEWRAALHELIEANKSEVDRARATELPLSTTSKVAEIVGCSPDTIVGLFYDKTPSMDMIRRLLEATGRAYMVESIEAPEMIGAGSGRPKTPLSKRFTADDLRKAMAESDSWSAAADSLGIAKQSFESLVDEFGLEDEFPPRKGHLTIEVLRRAFDEHGPVLTTKDLESIARRLRYHPDIVRRKAYEYDFLERGLLPRRLRSS